jgi:hypothetical protein
MRKGEGSMQWMMLSHQGWPPYTSGVEGDDDVSRGEAAKEGVCPFPSCPFPMTRFVWAVNLLDLSPRSNSPSLLSSYVR